MLYRLRPDEEIAWVHDAALYADGYCPVCQSGRGVRTSAVRRLCSPLRSDLAFVDQGVNLVLIVTPRLRAVLLEMGLQEADFGPVLDSRGRELFELTRTRDVIPWVGLREDIAIKANAVGCSTCGSEMFLFVHKRWGKGIFAYVEEASLPRLTHSACMAGYRASAEVLVNESGYVRLLQAKELRGVHLTPVGIVKSCEVERNVTFKWVTAKKQDEQD